MERPVFLVENALSTFQFPAHTIVPTSELTGFEVGKLSNGRRSLFDFHTPTTENLEYTLKLTCDRVRAFDMSVLDRGHNLAGKTFSLEISNDDFTTTEVVYSITFPTTSAPGSLDDALGVVTEEGAWVKRFPWRAAKYWRFKVAAVASYKPQFVGVWLGLSWSPTRLFDTPWSEDMENIVARLSESADGWQGSDEVTPRREGQTVIRLATQVEYDLARYTLAHYSRRRPMWICYDTAQADRVVLTIRQPGRLGLAFNPEWWRLRKGVIAWQEHEPLKA